MSDRSFSCGKCEVTFKGQLSSHVCEVPTLHYQKILRVRRKNLSSIVSDNPQGHRWKVGAIRYEGHYLSAEDVYILTNHALNIADELDEIHKMVSSANGNEVEIVEAIQSMMSGMA